MNKMPNEIKVQVRFPHDVWEGMKQLALKHERSTNGEIIWALREYIKQQEEEQKNDRQQKDQT